MALARSALGRVGDMAAPTPGGVAIRPLYPRHRGDSRQPWRAGGDWTVAQRVDHPDPAQANAIALADLEGGADALVLVAAGAPFSHRWGIAPDPQIIAAALEGVELDLIALRLDGGGAAALDALATLALDRRLSSAGMVVDGGCDPIGRAACTGARADLDQLDAAVAAARRGGFKGCPLLADGRPYGEAGAGGATELAAVVATAVAYLRHLAAAGVALDEARGRVAMLLTADADLMLGIGKMRAARRLWARIEEACGLDPQPLRLHAETSWRCLTRRDPHTNALRGALGAAAAGLGGADVVAVLPMTLAAGLSDAAARRLARNTNRILIDEAHLARVDDPAGGSGALESITEELCEAAWELFQRIEAEGGLPTAGAWLRRQLQADDAHRAASLADGSAGIVGTTLFPRLDAAEADRSDISPPSPPRAPDDARDSLPRRRDAERFEALRDRGEAAGRPSVFLATMGAAGEGSARASSAANLLAVAGLAATAPVAAGPAEIVERFRTAGAKLACLCGSDQSYRDAGDATIAALRRAGAGFVMMAGEDEGWLKRGVDALIHDRCELAQVLALVLEKVEQG